MFFDEIFLVITGIKATYGRKFDALRVVCSGVCDASILVRISEVMPALSAARAVDDPARFKMMVNNLCLWGFGVFTASHV